MREMTDIRKIDSVGRIILPKPILFELGWRPNTMVHTTLVDDGIYLHLRAQSCSLCGKNSKELVLIEKGNL